MLDSSHKEEGDTVTSFLPSYYGRDRSRGWYTRRHSVMFVALLFVVVQSLSVLIPPFQSPDEVNHIKRAYTLAQGELLPMRQGNLVGGEVDPALLAYTDPFSTLPFDYAAKETRALTRQSGNIRWSANRVFSDFSNTALYFPIPYIPQALAMWLGERMHFTVSASYFMARQFSLTATLALVLCALVCYPVPMFVIAIFLVPMTLFQMASASMDSVCFAISLLAASLFMRGSDKRLSFGPFLHGSLVVCLVVLATVRQNLLCFALLPAALYPVRRSTSCLVSAGIGFLAAVVWLLYLTANFPVTSPYNITTSQTIALYLSHPQALASMVFKTATNLELLVSVRDSFIGVLGGLDTPLGADVYTVLSLLLVLLAVVTVQARKEDLLRLPGMSLIGGGLVATGILLFLMLAIWTPYQAPFIQGIQGRYFVPIVVLAGFPVFRTELSPFRLKLGYLLMLAILGISMVSTDSALLSRYWLGE